MYGNEGEELTGGNGTGQDESQISLTRWHQPPKQINYTKCLTVIFFLIFLIWKGILS